MGAAPDRIFSAEDTIKALSAAATETSDEFVLKVFRRMHLASPPTVIAVFEGAVVQHFISPELWLPALAGGGKLMLQGFHISDLNKSIGSFLTFNLDSEEMRDVDLSSTKKPDWRGPAKLIFPKEAERRQQADMPLYDVRTPPGPGSSDSATRSTWVRQPGGGSVQRQGYEDGGDGLAFGPRAAALEAERRKLEAEKLDMERERHKAELVSREAAHKAEMAQLKSELRQEIQVARAEKPTGPDPMLEFMKMQAADRQAAEDRRRADAQIERERQDRIDARAAEDRRLERERQDKMEQRMADDRRADRERTDKLFEKLSERKEKDPMELVKQVTDLVGKKGDNSEMLMKSMNNMMEVQSTVMGATMDFVEHAARLNLGGGGEDEPGWVKGVDRLIKGIGKFAQAGAMRGPMFPQPPQVPAQAQGQQPQPQPQPPQGQAQQPRPPQTDSNAPIIDQIIGGIFAHYDVKMVAKAIIAHYRDESVQRALAEAGGDPEKAILSRLGNWPGAAPQNAAYLAALKEELNNQLQQAGYFDEEEKPSAKASDEGEDADADADDDQGEEEGDETEE